MANRTNYNRLNNKTKSITFKFFPLFKILNHIKTNRILQFPTKHYSFLPPKFV